MSVSSQLKQYRSELRISQHEAAVKHGIPLRTWQQWEQGRREPRGSALSALRSIFNENPPGAGGTSRTFAEWLKLFRLLERLTQPAAAAHLGIPIGSLQAWECERRVPAAKTVARLLPIFAASEERAAHKVKLRQCASAAKQEVLAVATELGFRHNRGGGRPTDPARLAKLLNLYKAAIAAFRAETNLDEKMKIAEQIDGWARKLKPLVERLREREEKLNDRMARASERDAKRKARPLHL